MPVKVYISGISGNKEVKKRQQRVLMILDSKNIKYDVVDITEPGCEGDKDFMQNNSTSLGATVGDTNPRHPLPPQLFNDASYCGDYDQFDLSNEIDELEKFLKLAPSDSDQIVTSTADVQLGNGKADNAVDNFLEAAATEKSEDPTEESADNVPDSNETPEKNGATAVNGDEEEVAEEDEDEGEADD